MAQQPVGSASRNDGAIGKIIWRIMPFLVLCDVISVVDRFNIGFAKLQFMKDLSLNEAVVGIAASAFYVGYTLCEIPSTLMMQKLGMRATMLRIMGLWGLVTVALAFVGSKYHLYTLRFLLGVAEAGFMPGVMLYLTYWIPERYSGRVASIFLLALPISGVISGPISGLILDGMGGVWGLHGWQWLFILEGAPSVVLGVIAYYYLDDRPKSANWLTEEEKNDVEQELTAEQLKASKGHSSFSRIFRNPQIYGLSAVYFCFYATLNAMTIWPPSILKFAGVQSVTEIGLRSSALSGAAVVGMILIGWNSDRLNERRWHLIACCLVAGAAFMALPLGAGNPNLTTLLLAVASIGIYSYFGLFWTIPRTRLDKEAAAGGIAVITTVGAIGSIISPTFVGEMREITGSFYGALGALGATFCLSTVVLYFCSGTPRKRIERKLRSAPNVEISHRRPS